MLGAIHLGRLAYPGRGVLENRTSIVIFTGILLFNPDRRGRGGLKILIFPGRP